MASLTPAEQAALTSGAGFWTTAAVGDVPSLLLTDGPHGVRRPSAVQADTMGIGPSDPATCFPPAVGLSQSWDPDLVTRIGAALGVESRAAGVGVLLGPGINIKRDPRGGRNFEYYSEDPHLTGVLGAAWVNGLQSRGVGASVKHFAANNAEHDRMRASSDVDPRPLREIYLRAFETVVRESRPWTVMASYNRINGVYATESRWLLTEVLRGEWGFDGVVVSDWGAVGDRLAALAAGLDLDMPGGRETAALVGTADPALLDASATRVAALARRAAAASGEPVEVDVDAHHRLAREAAGRCVVLLRNDGDLLPLTPDRSVAVLGSFAVEPRYQGGGSSHMNPSRLDVPLEEIRALGGQVTFSVDDPAVAAAADTAVLFLGLAASEESEGFDRTHIELPAEQLQLLDAVLAVQPRTVVVLVHGGVLRLAPLAGVPAVLDAALLGQAGGGAIADVLYGAVNPSGKLTETVPVRIQDTPAYLSFPGEHSHVRYGEGIFVGYRWYDARDLEVGFPFGHGLSYTSFAYSDLRLSADPAGITATVTVTNTGPRAGREIVQFYRALPGSRVSRPPHELTGFGSVTLEPGASAPVSVLLRRADLAYWDVRVDRWVVEGGDYEVAAGASSRDLRVRGVIGVDGDPVSVPITSESTLGEVLADPEAAERFMAVVAERFGEGAAATGEALGTDLSAVIESIPIGRLGLLAGQGSSADLAGLLSGATEPSP